MDELHQRRRYRDVDELKRGMKRAMMAELDDDLTRRAFAAWFRSGGTDQPSSGSGVTEWQGKQYVVLRNVNGTLAVYRVRPGGQLKRLKRWPRQVADK